MKNEQKREATTGPLHADAVLPPQSAQAREREGLVNLITAQEKLLHPTLSMEPWVQAMGIHFQLMQGLLDQTRVFSKVLNDMTQMHIQESVRISQEMSRMSWSWFNLWTGGSRGQESR